MQFESHDGLGQVPEVRLNGTRERLRLELELIVKTETKKSMLALFIQVPLIYFVMSAKLGLINRPMHVLCYFLESSYLKYRLNQMSLKAKF